MGNKLWLNVGCGKVDNPQLVDDGEIIWERLDGSPNALADILHDIRKPFPKAMRRHYDGVFMSHVLEHISYRETFMVLKNISKCLVPGGHVVVIVPDLEYACTRILNGEYDLGLMSVLYGGQMDEFDYHCTGFTMNTAKFVLEHAGFTLQHTDVSPFEIIFEGELLKGKYKQLILVAYK